MMKLSVIIPAHNEEENIADVIHRVQNSLPMDFELIIVEDHSEDSTADIVRRLSASHSNIRLIENKREKGFANALKTGFDNASGDMVLPIMGDLCDDLSSIKPMLEKMDEGYDVVCGSRYIKGGARLGGSKLKGFLSCWGGKSLQYLLGLPTHDITNAFKIYRKAVIDNMEIQSRGFEISMEMLLKAYRRGFKITEVPTVWKEREKGKSNFKVFKLLPDYIKLYLRAIRERPVK